VEFADTDSVPLALGLNGQRLHGVPIIVQPSQAEKNRLASMASAMVPVTNKTGPMRLYVGSLHFNITEDMLRGIFEPFGKVSEWFEEVVTSSILWPQICLFRILYFKNSTQ
jgi:RNA-binding protein 39